MTAPTSSPQAVMMLWQGGALKVVAEYLGDESKEDDAPKTWESGVKDWK